MISKFQVLQNKSHIFSTSGLHMLLSTLTFLPSMSFLKEEKNTFRVCTYIEQQVKL